MRVRGNWTSLISLRAFTGANNRLETSLSRLSSGLRIRSAADDAAGLGISALMRGQFNGLVRANRNALDGVSLVNTAEGALDEVHSLLQRGRQLTIQAANGTYTDSERQMLQEEMSQILTEIDRIADAVSFNGQRLLRSSGAAGLSSAIEGLRSGWLEQAENLISTLYGLNGDGVPLRIQFEYNGLQPTWISGDPNGMDGRLDNLTLHINLATFGIEGGPDGGSGPMFNDRLVARALTQATLARNSDYANLANWFKSGVADYLVGRDEQLRADVTAHGSAAILSAIDSWTDGSSLHMSSAYLATKYLDSLLPPFTMVQVMQELSWGNDLDSALLNTVGLDLASFVTDFKLNGAAFLATLDLNDADVGAIGGGNAEDVVPNGGTYSLSPLANFEVVWPTAGSAPPIELSLQVGANAYETLRVLIPEVSTFSLNLLGLNLVTRSADATQMLDAAIDQVSQTRTYLGSTANRLEHIMQANGENSQAQLSGLSRIVDLDMAHEMTNLTRQQIMLSSSGAMLAQSNTVRQHVMWLLRDLSPPGVMALGAN